MDKPSILFTDQEVTVATDGAEQKVSAEAYANSLTAHLPESGILPPAVRWISPTRNAIILERPPMTARLAYRHGEAGELKAKDALEFIVPVPWQVYGMVFGPCLAYVKSLFVFVRSHPIEDETSKLSMFPYPNVFNTSEACLGESFHETYGNIEHQNIAAAMQTVLNTFWMGDFNEDTGPAGAWYSPWRAPAGSMPASWRDVMAAGGPAPEQVPQLLKYYAGVPLQDFVRFEFPVAATLDPPDSDTLGRLITKLRSLEEFTFQNASRTYESMRKVHVHARFAEKMKAKAEASRPKDKKKLLPELENATEKACENCKTVGYFQPTRSRNIIKCANCGWNHKYFGPPLEEKISDQALQVAAEKMTATWGTDIKYTLKYPVDPDE